MGRLLLIPAAMLVLLFGAMVWSGGGVEQRADFAFINRGDIYTLDLNQMSYMQDFRLTYAIREGLFSPDPVTFRPTPAGAIRFDLSDDKKVWTFHLRPEARWSNGDPVTAHDYVFSWRRLLQEPGEYTYLFYYIRNAEAYEETCKKDPKADFSNVGVEALNDLTLRVSLNNPVTYFEDLLAFPPFYPRNEKSMEPFKETVDGRVSYRADYTRPPHVVTNGAYNLTRWDYKRRLILEKSPTYWNRDNVLSDRVEMIVSESPLSQYLLYETGQVDWLAEVQASMAAELKTKQRTDLRVSPAFGTAFLTLLCREELPDVVGGGRNPLADVRVRQALAMSIDRKFITENITRMGELPARTYLPPDGTLPDFRWLPGPYHPAGARQEPYSPEEVRALLPDTGSLAGPGLPYDPARAARLLADAGYQNGQGFPTLPILYNSDNATRGAIAQALKVQWKKALNINVEVQQIEGKIFKERVSKKQYAIATVAWYGDYPDASTFTDKYLSTSLQNDSDWINRDFDALCAQATKEGDVEKRLKILSQAEAMIDSEAPIIPMYHYVNVSLSRDTVEGVRPNPRNLTIFSRVRVNR